MTIRLLKITCLKQETLVSIGKKEGSSMNKSKKKRQVGLIAEDKSDVDALKVIIRKIAKDNSINFSHFIGHGCGKIQRKCNSWVQLLELKGCKHIIIVHDLDRNVYKDLYKNLLGLISAYNQERHLINIPIEEMEAWFLADMDAVKAVFNLPKTPKAISRPESVLSPKERLGEVVYSNSKKTKEYLNTSHNSKLAEKLSLDTVKKKCKSFSELYDFVSSKL